LLPYTGDEVYLWAFERVVLPLVSDFAPDVLVTQLGVDTHYLDPLAHLQLTTAGYTSLVRHFREMNLPWVALGGGGYNVHTVVRAWTLAYGIMSDQEFADPIPEPYAQEYGGDHLHDQGAPRVGERDIALTREYAERQVAALGRALGRQL
jgi:acetoin utilization protein AcuC